MKITVCQINNIPESFEECFLNLQNYLLSNNTDLLLLPEMPFSSWLAQSKKFDKNKWKITVDKHKKRIESLSNLNAKYIIGTRPIIDNKGQLLNEAFLYDTNNNISSFY